MASILAYLDDFGKMKVHMDKGFYGGRSNCFYASSDDGFNIKLVINGIEETDNEIVYDLTTPTGIRFGVDYTVWEEHGASTPLIMRFIVNTNQFNERFYYSGNDLGAIYNKAYTDFAIWTPVASSVILKLRINEEIKTFPMIREKKGVFRIRVEGDLKNASYTYLVNRNGEVVESIDPYAISSTANGKESAVIDIQELEKIKDYEVDKLKSATDAIIYETNVRDMTSNKKAGTTTNGLFASLCEENTYYKDMKTGLSYLADLGVTHIQLQPVNDFATVNELSINQYNWGYDPLQYLTPEGSYSTNPNDAYARIKELKKMISAMHKHGLKVVLDVVYNHVYDVSSSSFNKIMPYYYFRYTDSAHLSNGSYCGNDIASEKPMVRKYLLYVIKMLFELYKIDGLRFDLMGILDVETINEVVKLVKKIKDDALIYGEGWDMPTLLDNENKASMNNAYKMAHVGYFNDNFRDIIKGKTSDDQLYEKGYLTGDLNLVNEVASCLCASIIGEDYLKKFDEPYQSINALETHDNHTLWDKMHYSNHNEDRTTRQKRQKLLIATTLLAQGIPFIHMGEEYCGTKNDFGNSYNLGDGVNQFDYDRAIKNKHIIDYTKKLIELRKAHSGFRLKDSEAIINRVIVTNSEDGVIYYEINDSKEIIRVIINPTFDKKEYVFEEGFKIIFDEDGNNSESEDIKVAPLSLIVTRKENKI